MTNFLLFNKTMTFETSLSEEKFLDGVENHSYDQIHTDGEIYENGFHMTYSSNFGFSFQNPFPAIVVIGQTSKNGNKIKVNLKMKLNAFIRYFFLLAIIVFVTKYFLALFSIIDAKGISESVFHLYALPFLYFFLLVLYFIESSSCEEYFETMFRRIERENKNEL